MAKGGESVKGIILFEKYLICEILESGIAVTVYQVLHLTLEEYRIIKQVSKKNRDYSQILQEAEYLKQLNHPCIPIIYDLEEDVDNIYLIEEYLQGETLYDLVKSQGSMLPDTLIAYGIQICELVHFLHSVRKYPILHLDIQPKNLMLCDGIIKLIDFDHAATVQQANQIRKRYGTQGCAAPELYTSNALDERTDIYAIGALLYFLGSGELPPSLAKINNIFTDINLNKILHTCLSPDKADRFQSAELLLEQLSFASAERIGGSNKKAISSLIIIFVGSRSGIGTTHLALGVSRYLRSQGISCLYEECNQSGDVDSMASCLMCSKDCNGCYQFYGLTLKPYYGRAVKLDKKYYQVILKDYGANWKEAQESYSDALVLLSGTQLWEQENGRIAIEFWKKKNNLVLVFRKSHPRLKMKIPNYISKNQCFVMPCLSEPFSNEKADNLFYRSIWKKISQVKEVELRVNCVEFIRNKVKKLIGLLV